MKTIRLLPLLLLAALSHLLSPVALGATITGLIQDTTGNALTNSRVIFQPLGRPAVNGGALLTSLAGSVTTSSTGTFTNSLAPGDYTVVVGGRDRFTISVPNNSSTNSLVDLISTALQYTYTVPPSVYPVATTVRSGTARTDATVADPVVYLSSTVDTLLSSVNSTKLTKTGDTIGGTFTNSSDLTFDGFPGGGSGYASYTNSVYFNDLANFELGQVGNTYLDAISDTTIRGQSNLWILAPKKLYFLTPEIAGFSVGTNAVPVLTDPTTGEVKFVTLESLRLGSSVTAGKVLGKSSVSGAIISGSVDAADVASATTLSTVSNTATAALPKAGGTLTGAVTFDGSQPTATTSAANIVQLLDGTNSTSVTRAATANSVKLVNDVANNALPKAGGTMTGALTLSGAPTATLHPATKGYVDALRVDNLAALMALPSGSIARVDLLGYTTPGDGGGGMLYFTNTVSGTNTGTRYAANGGGSWQRVVYTPLNPRWFGAVGDWNTDDTVAFQAALDTVDPTISNTNQNQTRIEITPGWYKVGSLTANNNAEIYGSVRVKGAGFSTYAPTLFQKAGASGALLKTAPQKKINVHDLQFSGRASANIQNSNTIATVTDRTHFSVSSTNNVPPNVLSYFPYGGVCLFYTTNNTLVGSGVVGGVTNGTNITIKSGYDWFATDSSSNLSTGWIVAFTPWKNWTNASGAGKSPYITADPTNYFAPAISELGNCAIQLVRSADSVISRCNISGFTTGIGTLGANGIVVDHCDFYANHLAGIWLDNCYDSTIDSIQVTGQPLANGTFKNEFSSVLGGVLNQGTALTDVPVTNSLLCGMRSAVGGWNVASCIGNHWRLDFGNVDINWSGTANEVFRLSDVTADNVKLSLMVLDGDGSTQADWVRSFTLWLLNNSYPAIKTYGTASCNINTLHLVNVANITPRFSYAVDTSESSPRLPVVIQNLLAIPNLASVIANTNQTHNPANAVVTMASPGQVPLGSTMTADPTNSLGIATKQYADTFMPKAGGTFTGAVTLNADPASALQASTKQYVDTFMPKAGGTFTGTVTLNADPASALQASTKQYVDTFMPKAGGTFTGTVTLNADPASALQASTKQYVDNNFVGKGGSTMTGSIRLPNGTSSVSAIGPSADAGTGLGFTSSTTTKILSNGQSVGAFNQTGHLLVGGDTDSLTGATLQVVNVNGTGGVSVELTGYTGDPTVVFRSASGSSASPTATTSSRPGRPGLFYGTTNGTTWIIGGRIEMKPLATWTGTNYGMAVDLWTTDATSTTAAAARQRFVPWGAQFTDSGTVASPDASTVLQLVSTNRGFLAPVMTRSQFDAISSRLTGLSGYDTTAQKPVHYNGTRSYNGTLELSASATLDFGSTAAGAQTDLTITVTGAQTGDSVCLGLPAAPAAGIVWNAWVSATDTVTVRASNITAIPVDPASATYKVKVFAQ